MQTAASDGSPSNNFAVLRVKRNLLSESYVGILATNKEYAGGYNRGLGGDADFRFSNFIGTNTLDVGAALAATQTPGLVGNNLAYRAYVDYPNDLIDHFIGFRGVQENFNPEVGFVYRRGNQLSWHLVYAPRPGVLGIRQLFFKPVDLEYYWDVNNKPESARWEWRPLGFLLQSGEYFEFNIQRVFDRLDDSFEIFPGDTIPQASYLFTHYELQFATNQSRPISAWFFYNWGKFYTGYYKRFIIETTLKMGSHFSCSATYDRDDVSLLTGDFAAKQFQTSVDYAFSTRLNTTVYAQWNNEDNFININFRLHWIPQIGSEVYLVYNQLLTPSGKIRPALSTLLAKVAYRFVI